MIDLSRWVVLKMHRPCLLCEAALRLGHEYKKDDTILYLRAYSVVALVPSKLLRIPKNTV